MPLICPTCKTETRKIISRPHVDYLFCVNCADRVQGRTRDGKVYSGRKFWAGHEAYNRNQLEEKAYNYEQGCMERAAANRKQNEAQERHAVRMRGKK